MPWLIGEAVVKVLLGKNYSMDGGVCVAVDNEADVVYVNLAPAHGGNTFTLWAIDAKTGAFLRDPVVMVSAVSQRLVSRSASL